MAAFRFGGYGPYFFFHSTEKTCSKLVDFRIVDFQFVEEVNVRSSAEVSITNYRPLLPDKECGQAVVCDHTVVAVAGVRRRHVQNESCVRDDDKIRRGPVVERHTVVHDNLPNLSLTDVVEITDGAIVAMPSVAEKDANTRVRSFFFFSPKMSNFTAVMPKVHHIPTADGRTS